MTPPPPEWCPPASGVIRGCWQLSRGHGPGWTREAAFAALDTALDAALDDAASSAGRLVLDCADIYTAVERLIGDWMAARQAAANDVVVHTKFVPDLAVLADIDRSYTRRIVLRSRERLGVDALELVQFAWWDYSIPGWINAAEWLAELQQEGVIRHIGVTNFDRHTLRTLLDEGIPVVSNQVQFSLLDRRPLRGLTDLCRERGVTLLCYGTLAGGLLSEGARAPGDARAPGARDPADSRSLAKYRLIVDEAGGPIVLERGRAVLADIADRQSASMAETAVAYVLSQPSVGAAIVGLSRRGLTVDGRKVRLRQPDIERLEAAVPDAVAGAVFEVERDRTGPHGRIMKYDLNRASDGANHA